MHWLKVSTLASVLMMVAFLFGCDGAPTSVSEGIRVVPFADYQADGDCAAKVQAMREGAASTQPLHQRYQDLQVIDVHNHGAAAFPLWTWWTLRLQGRYFVDRTVLFGRISEPAAVKTDQQAWEAYAKYPDQVLPFFAGIPLRDQAGIAMAAANLEQGYYGIGEIVAASTHSPVASRMPWKAQHPNDGILPELYQLSARYGVPVLLHIQFMVSTDSGYGVGQTKALQAIYELLDLLTPETACTVSHQNMERIIFGSDIHVPEPTIGNENSRLGHAHAGVLHKDRPEQA